MQRLNRRRFMRALSSLSLIALLAPSVGCASFKPAKFATGDRVAPPFGCQQLRQSRADADC